MSQQKVQTFSSTNFGRTILMAFLGEVTFDKEGISTQAYDEKLVDQACEAYDDLAAVFEEDLNSDKQEDDLSKNPAVDPLEKETDEDRLEDPDTKRVEEDEDNEDDEEGESEENNDDEDEADEPAMTKEEAEALLEGKSLEELRTIASDSGFPEGEWKSFRAAKNLTSYLVGKLTATQA